ncbi:MAG: hypothetical protein ACU843_17535 [Gammaproteobacteria bacterium]
MKHSDRFAREPIIPAFVANFGLFLSLVVLEKNFTKLDAALAPFSAEKIHLVKGNLWQWLARRRIGHKTEHDQKHHPAQGSFGHFSIPSGSLMTGIAFASIND